MDYNLLTDEQLAISAQNKDADAMQCLINRYKSTVSSISRSYFLSDGDIEDLIQEGMICVFRAIETFNGASEFKYYAYKCIKNGIFSAIKKSKSGKNLPLYNYISLSGYLDGDTDKNIIIADENFGPEETLINKESAQELKNIILTSLNENEYQILKLYLNGYSYKDISEKVDKSTKQIDNSLQRIKKKLTIAINKA